MNLAGNIGLESSLTFLGLGLPERQSWSLGTLISYARNPDVLENKWWIWVPASLMILVLMLSINFVGQALKRAADEDKEEDKKRGVYDMKIKSHSKVLSALAISSLLLAACSNDTEKSSTKEKKGKDVRTGRYF